MLTNKPLELEFLTDKEVIALGLIEELKSGATVLRAEYTADKEGVSFISKYSVFKGKDSQFHKFKFKNEIDFLRFIARYKLVVEGVEL